MAHCMLQSLPKTSFNLPFFSSLHSNPLRSSSSSLGLLWSLSLSDPINLRVRPRRRRPSRRCGVSASSFDTSVFGAKRELSGPQFLVNVLTPPARAVISAICVTAAFCAGYGLGSQFGGSHTAALGGAAILGAAVGAAVYAMNSSVPEVAAVSLHNLVAGHHDPTELRKEDVDGIAEKYGVRKQAKAFKAELCDLYSRFVSSVLPPGSENLKGNEGEMLLNFKETLGIDDRDAASIHMEIGRRIVRESLKTGDRESDAFQKLIYISSLVFGEAQKFLLPWKRHFKVTDSQVYIAIRDNAQRLYALKLQSVGRDIDEKQLIDLRESQLVYKLSDELAAEMFKDHVPKLVEGNISTALGILKSRTKSFNGTVQVIEELEKVLAFNNLLLSLSKHSEVGRFAPGVGPVSLLGGVFNGDRKMDDLKLLFKVYATESFSNGSHDEKKHVGLNQLKNIFGLGNREAAAIMVDIAFNNCSRWVSQVFSGSEFDAALCDASLFYPHKASEIHEGGPHISTDKELKALEVQALEERLVSMNQQLQAMQATMQAGLQEQSQILKQSMPQNESMSADAQGRHFKGEDNVQKGRTHGVFGLGGLVSW